MLDGVVVISRSQSLYPWERAPVFILEEAEWALGPVWRGMEKIK